jgi:predicted phosphodiesterase
MRFGVISDIHGNLVALEAVLADMGDVDQLWCLGDVVGYGPQPNECMELLLDSDHVAVMGNHDAAAVGLIPARSFNGEARRALEWTARRLTKEHKAYLKGLPERLEHNQVLLVHGSPLDPVWEYITTREQASDALAASSSPYVFVGHTHLAAVYVEDADGRVLAAAPTPDTELPLGERKALVNPGSVGQPRDGDARAAYAVVDSEEPRVEFHRVEYDIPEAQRRMRAAGASDWLTERLQYGR